jgi:hypothetical protein
MKRKIYTVLSVLFLGTGLCAQNVGIGTATPAASAKLDITDANRGVLVPRVALTATNAAGPVAAPATSLLVYNTATAGAAPFTVTPGYYYNAGTPAAPNWLRFSTGGDDWKITGNANTISGTNFLGTTNAQALDFRTNNTLRFRVANANQVHALADGTAALPFYSWGADPNTGMYNLAADIIGLSTNGIERMRISNAATVINEGAADYDFRVESMGNQNMFFVDGGTNRVGIGTNTPSEALDVIGNVEFSGSLEPNTQPGVLGQALVSQGANIAPVWGVNVNGLTEISRWIYPPTNINSNTTYTLTATIPGVTSSSSVMVNLYGDWATSPAANITIHHVEARTGAVRFIVRNSSGTTNYTGMDFVITVIR